METLNEIWPYVENIGIPILAAIGGITFFSINYYFRDCKNLYLMETYIKENKSLKGFNYQIMPLIGPNALYYSFKSLSNFDEKYMRIPKFKKQVESIRACKISSINMHYMQSSTNYIQMNFFVFLLIILRLYFYLNKTLSCPFKVVMSCME